MPPTLPNRIKAIRKAKGLSQEELGAVVNRRKQSVSQYETGKREPPRELLVELADSLGIRRAWLLAGEGEMLLPGQGDGDSSDVPEAVVPPSAAGADSVDVVHVPVFADAGAGPGQLPQEQEHPERYVTVSLAEFVQHFRERPTGAGDLRRFGYFEVTGRSAAPFYFNGELVPVELLPEATQDFRNDTLYIYRWQGHLYMKVLRRIEGSTIRAASLNRSIEPFTFTPENGHDFAVVARVIETEKQQLYDTLMHRFLGTGEVG